MKGLAFFIIQIPHDFGESKNCIKRGVWRFWEVWVIFSNPIYFVIILSNFFFYITFKVYNILIISIILTLPTRPLSKFLQKISLFFRLISSFQNSLLQTPKQSLSKWNTKKLGQTSMPPMACNTLYWRVHNWNKPIAMNHWYP